MAGKANLKQIKNKIYRNRTIQNRAYSILNKEVTKEKNIFTSNFNSHPVTQELEGGENAKNISGTLGGYGNLFSFLGFSKGQNPTIPVKLLIESIVLYTDIKPTKNGFRFKVKVPSKQEFELATLLPWEGGRSWLLDMDRGISGFSAYVYGRFKRSRSGSGIQNNLDYSNRAFRPVKYFNQMYNNFLIRLGAK